MEGGLLVPPRRCRDIPILRPLQSRPGIGNWRAGASGYLFCVRDFAGVRPVGELLGMARISNQMV